jgi:small subunit ribosomal protein S1
VVRAQVLEIDKEKRQLRLSMKQLVPTGLDEFLAEHAAGDTVTGRVVAMEHGVAQIELGEAIIAACALPNEVNVLETPAAEPTSSGTVDLSILSSMLKSKWKSGPSLLGLTAKAEPKKREPVSVGQVRSFRIGRIDLPGKRIELELAE